MPSKKRQHFIPQHYLRQFRILGTKQVAASRIDPYLFIGPAAIGGQCQEDYFYGADGEIEEMMTVTETSLAPVLANVSSTRRFDSKERVALNWLAVSLHLRTRKAVAHAKVYPKMVAHRVISAAIASGRLPPPPGGVFTPDMMDFDGVPRFLIVTGSIPCWLEMQTLDCKILEAPSDGFFCTSDHPVVLMNQLFAEEADRSFVGFSRSGFQVVLPISPDLCLFFFDPRVYKVGTRSHSLVPLEMADVDALNGLQVRSADRCLYFHDTGLEKMTASLVNRFAPMRNSVEAHVTTTKLSQHDEFWLMRSNSLRFTGELKFCRRKRHIGVSENKRRNPAWTALVQAVAEDMRKNPGGADVFDRIEKILGCSVRSGSS